MNLGGMTNLDMSKIQKKRAQIWGWWGEGGKAKKKQHLLFLDHLSFVTNLLIWNAFEKSSR